MQSIGQNRDGRTGAVSSPALCTLAERFPQLYLAPMEGRSQTELYRDIVRKGSPYTGSLDHFTGSSEDRLWTEETPAGPVQVLFLKNRGDFICCYQIMACRCEPKPVPESMGAVTIDNLNDWALIRAHLDTWEAEGHSDRAAEFRRFTADPKNYRTTLILLSEGSYSALDASQTPYPPEEWLRLSYRIRLYHELTHFVCRREFPQFKHAVFDELLADCMGLVFATGSYRPELARAFLGITRDGSYRGGRLENYLHPGQDLAELAMASHRLVDRLAVLSEQGIAQGTTGYPLMLSLGSQAPQMIREIFGPPENGASQGEKTD